MHVTKGKYNKIWMFLLAACILFILLFVLHVGQEAPSAQNGKQVLMLYMVGSNLESERGLASADIKEIQESGFDEENFQILICTGGAAYWWNDSISPDECAVYEVHGDSGLSKVTVLDTDNMAETASLTAFMDFVYENYEADSYSMILWNHGGGAVIGYGGDENHSYDMLSLYELDEAFADARLIREGKKLEWIGFDACLMGMLEVANTCAPYAGYLVASEGMALDDGWNYSFLTRICNSNVFSKEAVGREIVKSYGEYYTESKTYMPDYTLACLDLSKTEQVVDKLESFILVAEPDLKDGMYSVLAKERDQTKAFGIADTSTNYDIVDLYHLAERFAKIYPKEATELQEAVEEMVICEETNVADAHGIAIYFPYNNKENVTEWLDEYSRIGFSETYVDFVKRFSEILTGNSLAVWNMSDMEVIKDEEKEYSISLTPEQVKNYAHATFGIWESAKEWKEDCYVMWLSSSDAVLDEKNTVQVTENGKHFILSDDAGHHADCSAVELERTKNYAVYGISLYLSWIEEGENGEESKYETGWATVYVRVDAENPEGVITGIYEDPGFDMVPGRVSCELEQGVEINPFAFVRQITFDEDGRVVPFEEWKSYSTAFDGFKLEGNLSVTMVDIEDAELLRIFLISDTQGNRHAINYIE